MAVRFDAAADRLVRTSGLLDYNAAYTRMGWFYLASDTNDYVTFFTSNDNNAGSTMDEDFIGTLENGTTLQIWAAKNNSGSEQTGSSLSVSTWYHIAVVRESTSSIKLYLNGVLDITNTYSVTGRTAATRQEVGGWGSGNLSPLNGRAAYLKEWSGALTQAEILQEMNCIAPRRTADLYAWLPTFPGAGERARDYSGWGHDYTESGTLTDEDPPGVSWGGLLPFALGIPSPVQSADAATAVFGPSVSVGGPVTASPAPAMAAAACADLAVLQGPVSITPDPSNARARREGPVSDTTLLVNPAPCAARAGRAGPALDLGSVSITPAPCDAAAGCEAPSCVVAFLIRPEPCTAIAESLAPELFFSSCSLVPVFCQAAASAPSYVYRVLNVTVIDMTIGSRPADLALGERRGVHLIERWELEDGTGHWLFEDGSGIVLGLGLEGTKLNLWERSLILTVEDPEDAR